MKLTEVSAPSFDAKIEKNLQKILKAVKKEATRFNKHSIEVIAHGPFKAEVAVHFERYMSPESINDITNEIKSAIIDADENGHIFKLDYGDLCHGENFAEALLTGLRPGMSLKAEALFPTVSFEITWKNIVSSKK